jgi:hypothetical protein
VSPELEETHAELQAAVSTLSTGPVGPSDMIGHTNVSMLMQYVSRLFIDSRSK